MGPKLNFYFKFSMGWGLAWALEIYYGPIVIGQFGVLATLSRCPLLMAFESNYTSCCYVDLIRSTPNTVLNVIWYFSSTVVMFPDITILRNKFTSIVIPTYIPVTKYLQSWHILHPNIIVMIDHGWSKIWMYNHLLMDNTCNIVNQ